jgi:septation ring formation regulator EzrA
MMRSMDKETKNEFNKLGRMIKTGFDEVDKKFKAVDKRFEAVDKRFEAVDKRFEAVDKRFDKIDVKLDNLEKDHEEIKLKQDKVVYRFEYNDLERRVERLELKTGLIRP